MRLIDADELMEHVWRDKLDSRELIAAMIENAPTVKEISQMSQTIMKENNNMDIDRLIARDNLEELDSLRAENAELRKKKVPLTVGDAIDTLVDILYSDVAAYIRPIEKHDIRIEFESRITAKAKANENDSATTLCEKLNYNYCPYCGRPVVESESDAE